MLLNKDDPNENTTNIITYGAFGDKGNEKQTSWSLTHFIILAIKISNGVKVVYLHTAFRQEIRVNKSSERIKRQTKHMLIMKIT